jgi:hypothetical protein
MRTINKVIWGLVAILFLTLMAVQNKPVWHKAGDFLNINANKGCPTCK